MHCNAQQSKCISISVRDNDEVDRSMETVADYMSTRMVTTSAKDSVLGIARKMADRDISSIAITDDKDRIAGILTERDVVRAIARGMPPDGIIASSLMSHPVITIEKGASVEDAARVMAQKKLRHLLVEDGVSQEILGIITITDLARYLKKNLADEELAASEVWELFF